MLQDRWIESRRFRSNAQGLTSTTVSAASPVAVKLPETGQERLRGVQGRRGWLELVRRVRRTHWQDSDQQNETRGKRAVKGALRAGRGNSGEQSWPRGGGIGCDKARASSVDGRETLWATTGARDRANLSGRRAGAAN
jgi:hypothetical protein